jgi:hypothetical protein
MRIVVERGVSERGEDVVVHIPSARAAEEDVALGITIARELAERFGGSLVHDERGWTLTLRAAG